MFISTNQVKKSTLSGWGRVAAAKMEILK